MKNSIEVYSRYTGEVIAEVEAETFKKAKLTKQRKGKRVSA